LAGHLDHYPSLVVFMSRHTERLMRAMKHKEGHPDNRLYDGTVTIGQSYIYAEGIDTDPDTFLRLEQAGERVSKREAAKARITLPTLNWSRK
jgi:hypothetical protein